MMFRNIRIEEVPILAKIFLTDITDEDGKTYSAKSMEETLEDLELIDNMLSIMKAKSLLQKNRGLKKVLDGLLGRAVGDEFVVEGRSNYSKL